jgi:thiol:disulfide interchange protein
MAFPMFATVVWLTWILGQQTGLQAVVALLGLLVVLAWLLWSLGLAGRSRLIFAGLVAMVGKRLVACGRDPHRCHPAPGSRHAGCASARCCGRACLAGLAL